MDNSFEIQYEGQTYLVEKLDFQGTEVFKIQIGGKPVIITRATKQVGTAFWTCIPEGDQKLADKLGRLIDNYKTGENLLF